MRVATLLSLSLLVFSPSQAFSEEGEAVKVSKPAEKSAQESAARTYILDIQSSDILVTTVKAGFAADLGHQHVIAATKGSGKIVHNAKNPTESSIQVTVDVPSLSVDAQVHRAKVNFEGDPPDDGDRATIKENMLKEDQLWGEKHTTVSFQSTSITGTGPGKVKVEGKLTIRGVTQSVSFPAKIKSSGSEFTGDAKVEITHGQFGMEPFSIGFGAIGNAEELTLHLHLVGKVN